MKVEKFKNKLLKYLIWTILSVTIFNSIIFYYCISIHNTIHAFDISFIIGAFILEIIFSIMIILYITHRISKKFDVPFHNLIIEMKKFGSEREYTLSEPIKCEIEEINDFSQEYYNITESMDFIIKQYNAINMELQDSKKEVEKSYNYFTGKLIEIVEGYDENTGNHVDRVGILSELLAIRMGMSKKFCVTLRKFAPLHDIGKISIPQSILLKNDKLTDEEWDIMKSHTLEGAKLLAGSDLFSMAKNIALYHHEKYDGSGYPSCISGDDIPLEAAIVSLVDVYDALRSVRPYKKAFTHEEAINIIKNGDSRTTSSSFNPKILRVFLKYENEIEILWNNASRIIQ